MVDALRRFVNISIFDEPLSKNDAKCFEIINFESRTKILRIKELRNYHSPRENSKLQLKIKAFSLVRSKRTCECNFLIFEYIRS
jgi:hypothetical protein